MPLLALTWDCFRTVVCVAKGDGVGDEVVIDLARDEAFELSWSRRCGKQLFAAVSGGVVAGVGGPAGHRALGYTRRPFQQACQGRERVVEGVQPAQSTGGSVPSSGVGGHSSDHPRSDDPEMSIPTWSMILSRSIVTSVSPGPSADAGACGTKA
jgi:hypothetical protein